MPDETITIGNKTFEVACQEGEESYLHAAAALLDAEARQLIEQIGRMPEARMLLMAGLMLADKVAGSEERAQVLETELEAARAEITRLRSMPAPEAMRVEVPVVPQAVADTLAELTARAEALADQVEDAR